MELHLALKEIVEKEGSNILTETRLVNMLADYNAYENCSAFRFIIKSIIESDVINDILDFDSKQNNVEVSLNVITKKVCESFGFANQLVSYVIRSLFYSIDFIDSIQESICSVDYNVNIANSNSDKHLSFKGVSFDNTIEDFVRELEKKGCKAII